MVSMISIRGHLTKGERMDLEKIKQIKLEWKKNDNGVISIGKLFKIVEENTHSTTEEVMEAIHYDLTGKILGIVL